MKDAKTDRHAALRGVIPQDQWLSHRQLKALIDNRSIYRPAERRHQLPTHHAPIVTRIVGALRRLVLSVCR